MRRHFVTSLATVFVDDIRCVDRQTSVRVNDDAEQARVGLKVEGGKTMHHKNTRQWRRLANENESTQNRTEYANRSTGVK